MGSVLHHVPSDPIDSEMLGGAIIPSEPVYRPSSRPPSQSPRPTSSNTTPISTAAPPSTSTVGSARLPAHSNDIPAYIQSQTPSQTSASSMTSHPSHVQSHDQFYSQHSRSGNPTMAEPMNSEPHGYSQSSPASPRLQPTFRSMHSLGGSEASSPSRIRVRSLSHIQSLANEDVLAPRHPPVTGGSQRQFEISSMPVTEIIEMVAGILTKITTTNDMHHESVHRHIPPPDGTTNLTPQATSVLAFHGKNVPSITILSYLTRIHKYCPTTYEVFLSLLVYFDRMTELVNRRQVGRVQHGWDSASAHQLDSTFSTNSFETSAGRQAQNPIIVTPPLSAGMTAQDPKSPNSSISPALHPQTEDESLSHFFVVDSFNIHRLVIAGVTCASKFFSDVFYTNSRYAKVGGLPLVELNHLELQFLLLNDFRLAIPVEELEAYGTMLVEFYAREVLSQQQPQHTIVPRALNPPAMDSYSDAMYMRSPDKRRDPLEVGQTPTPP
ncbi:hypothetical protein NUU61_006905 [Penicillium alfredii]|uniref:Cyclin-domain-containing protein n=1 Tax=Penicillium alfredii TaxID=1506179 RepID=A0A9W9F230_9EURO|nr:uncharacterized protein NUU61_006905 [Penicillium alfredii]KAJ5092035.1 hypothetical protein NUU61_006905 [Penicillium alfredii]